ncbi:hypothetical protein C8R45DRAFT_844991 [Mycena sanguinolenta]|nr:hypothetical protein C8R45DRAFT_844991 [Mycena sanguinolenta]
MQKYPTKIRGGEIFWRDHQVWLQECGYMLRPRYRPHWVPSWLGSKKVPWHFEDALGITITTILDGVRVRDGTDVCLKQVNTETHPSEHEIGMFFSSGPRANDPRNHCVPILETLQVPDDEKLIIVVLPLLRDWEEPKFDTFGEAIDFFDQIFEGLKFMHDHNVAHRDCNEFNIMMDGSQMYPEGWHPRAPKKTRDFYSGRAKFYTRTQRLSKYYLIDFGLSRRYETKNPPPLEPVILGGDKSVPEHRFTVDRNDVPPPSTDEDIQNKVPPKPCDPFPTDIYYLGNMIRLDFLEVRNPPRCSQMKAKYGFEFMRALVDHMIAEDPAVRPTIDEVIQRFTVIRNNLSSWKLRSRVVTADTFPLPSRPLKHWYRRIGYILRRVPAVPSHKETWW